MARRRTGGPWRRIYCALPALWVGLHYDRRCGWYAASGPFDRLGRRARVDLAVVGGSRRWPCRPAGPASPEDPPTSRASRGQSRGDRALKPRPPRAGPDGMRERRPFSSMQLGNSIAPERCARAPGAVDDGPGRRSDADLPGILQPIAGGSCWVESHLASPAALLGWVFQPPDASGQVPSHGSGISIHPQGAFHLWPTGCIAPAAVDGAMRR